jgi:hypothetical protein
MKLILTTYLISLACVGYAQGVDSTKKTQPATSLYRYPQPDRLGNTSVMSSPRSTTSIPTFSNPNQNRVQSTYIYENGRVIGGSTTWKFGNKKK